MDELIQACAKQSTYVERELRSEIERLRSEIVKRDALIDGLRWRIYTLLRSADIDAETIGMKRITKKEN